MSKKGFGFIEKMKAAMFSFITVYSSRWFQNAGRGSAGQFRRQAGQKGPAAENVKPI